MKSFGFFLICASVSAAALVSCERLDDDPQKHAVNEQYVELSEVAHLLAEIPIQKEHLQEVHDAVCSSSGNGYDEEYTMSQLFEAPGTGVGETADTRSVSKYERPLRDLIQERLLSTKSSSGIPDSQKWLDELTRSDIQIYWPYSDRWDGETFPVITFDPEDDSDVNIGFRLVRDGKGAETFEEVIVDEQMAMETPVWVVNRNSDASYKTLEMLRKEDPSWGDGGGDIIVHPSSSAGPSSEPSSADDSPSKCLLLKSFMARRSFDCWFAGASEFFVKAGSVKDFTATTEAELKLYNPQITDFMIVVKRGQVGKTLDFNAMLISDWTEQLTHCAFMIIEDDGGTWTEWKCTALVRIASKSYGVEFSIPVRSWDDVVWRGRLAWDWLVASSGKKNSFGDVDLTFEVMEY